MTEEANVGRSWKSVARSDADIDLLQRSISHVENLLSRLEYGEFSAPRGSEALQGSDGTGADGSGTAEPAAVPQTTARMQTDGSTPAANAVPPAAHADALRITREAHEDAYQIRARADAVRAAAVTESERLLGEAQQRCEKMRADAISEVTARLDKLTAAAEAEADATERTARQRLATAVAEAASEADAVRLLVHNTFSNLVQTLSDTLDCLQRLTTAIRPDVPLTATLAEWRRLPGASDDPVSKAGFSPGAINGSPAAVSGDEGTTTAASAPITSHRPSPIFRLARH